MRPERGTRLLRVHWWAYTTSATYRAIAHGQCCVDPDVEDDEKGNEGCEEYEGEFLSDAHLHVDLVVHPGIVSH